MFVSDLFINGNALQILEYKHKCFWETVEVGLQRQLEKQKNESCAKQKRKTNLMPSSDIGKTANRNKFAFVCFTKVIYLPTNFTPNLINLTFAGKAFRITIVFIYFCI